MDEKYFLSTVKRALDHMSSEPYDYRKTHENLLEVTRKSMSILEQTDENSSEKFVLIYAGPNASGKSSIASNVNRDIDLPFLNPDMIAKEYFDQIQDEEDQYRKYAMPYTEKIRNRFIEAGRNFSFETVFSDPQKLTLISELKNQGYKIYTIWMGTNDPYINTERALRRQESGGHYVPSDKILSRYYKGMGNLSQLLHLSDTAVVVDNSTEEPYVVIQKIVNQCRLVYEKQCPEWITKYLLNHISKH
ncbi:zeta toxin family protein [Desulfosporosinus sp.]|uniref:zeta toxin family protein n=1 Tax=Desulfosporosinus sp. TaxID=157907 RepID=UPI00230E91D5|nr:zeta toxin family protein [Desulfosporosinus sp.]MDA8222504.1 zeta toxin family protein [Desulfitobacterium hafniense]